MKRFTIIPGDPGYFVIDTEYYKDGDHPMAVCAEVEAANVICDSINLTYNLNHNLLQVGTVWQKCGLRRAIVGVKGNVVHYESVPGRAITRMKAHLFMKWMDGADLIRVRHPIRSPRT